jgi:putative transposase
VESPYLRPSASRSSRENGTIESFNGKLRDELLNREIFYTLPEACILIEQWRRHHNGVRPHSALGYRPPAPETIAFPVMGLPYHWNPLETPRGFLH